MSSTRAVYLASWVAASQNQLEDLLDKKTALELKDEPVPPELEEAIDKKEHEVAELQRRLKKAKRGNKEG